ncbi:MAG: PrsW family intramembrane metalloprotease, partial [Microbacteriaceae bacterium]|nr:PrsW family intramembrane metalloprotease [Microbacteriaceae bacterium]
MGMTNPTAATPDHTASAGITGAAPATAPAAVAQSAVTAPAGLAAPVQRSSAVVALAIIGIIVLAVIALFVTVYLISGLGVSGFALGGVMALVPLAIVFFGVRWIDRWEPEPRAAVVFAFLWGAGVAVLIALLVGAEIDNVINSMGGPGPGYDFFAAAIQAPIVEETAKGLGVLILFWAARRHFDGPVDGLVYAAWVAGGFAFTENILYFGSELLNPQGAPLEIFLIRGIMSPFAHVMFTACTGLALGFAARRTGAFGAIGFFLLGLIPAIFLHALWNGALFFVSDFFAYYAIVQFPLFLGAVFLVLYLRRQEAKLTHDRLAEYAAVGWFSPEELPALA